MTDTTTEDAEPVDTTDTEDAELLLADPDDYHQAQRLREIHDARQRVHKTLDGITRWNTGNAHHEQRMDLADAVTAYITELEPLIKHADMDPSLPDALPWDSVFDYASNAGYKFEDGADPKTANYRDSMLVFRRCNVILAEVKPLITEDETTEWEV